MFLRSWIQMLPKPLVLYLHKDIKDSIPQVWDEIKEFNPWARGRREDSEVGWTFVPMDRRSGRNEDGEPYEGRTSRLGFFTPDEPLESAEQLVVLGDSFLSTFYATKPAAWVLRERLNIPVYALAVGGWGPESYRRAFIKYAKARNSKIVVVFTFNNDVTDVDNWLRWQRNETPVTFLTWIWSNNPDQESVNIGNWWIDRKSILWNWTKYVVRHRIVLKLHLSEGDKLSESGSGLEEFSNPNGTATFKLRLTRGYQFTVLDPEAFAPGGSYRPYMDQYFHSLIRLRDSIEGTGKKMLLVWIPAKERVYLPLLRKEQYVKYVTNRTGRINGLESALQRFTSEADLMYLDVTPEFTRRARNGEKLYFTSDGHLNSHGNRVLGELTARAISAARTSGTGSNPS
jgi:hypothetical protein